LGRWNGIRYHHLFRDFLQSRVEIELPGEKAIILGRLVEVYASRGEWDRGYAVCERLGEAETLANLVERAGSALIKGGRLRTVAEWVDALPAELTAKRPELLSLRGVAAIVQGEVERGLALLNQAEEKQRSVSDWPGLALTLARRATAQRFTGDYAAALADAIEARDLIRETKNYPAVEAEALRAAGMALYQSGRLSEAIERLSHSLSLYREIGDHQNVAMVSMELGLASMSAGYYRQAFSDYQQAFLYWRQAGNLFGQSNLLNNLGVLHHLMGEYEQGLDSFEEALACARQSGYVRMEAYILCGIGDLYSDLGAGDAALEAYTRSREIAHRIDYRFLLLYLDLAEAELARQAESLELAEGIVASAGRSISADESGYESGLWQLEVGRISLSRRKPAEAVQALSKANSLFETGGQRVEAVRTSLYLAVTQHLAGDLLAALSTLEKAIEGANHLESPHVLVIAGQEAKELLKTAVKAWGPAALPAARLLERVETFERRIPSLRRKLRPRSSTVPFSPPKLTIQALGRAQVDLDGKPVTVAEWQNQKRVREFFFCLLAHPNGLTKEEVGLVFWPDSSPAQLKLQFKNVIYRLRVALGPDTVLYDEDRYWFNRDLDYSYDVETLLGYLQRARSTDTIDEQISAFEAASEIYTGIYLPEMSGSWVWPERERLQRAHEEADLNLARLSLQSGDPNRTLTVCHKLLVEDPCLEEAHRLVMEAYSRLGNQAALARQFERCCQVLKEEVHSPPSQQTRDLYEKLRSAGTGA
jgi:DNA-binding SARP family transcriptional activator